MTLSGELAVDKLQITHHLKAITSSDIAVEIHLIFKQVGDVSNFAVTQTAEDCRLVKTAIDVTVKQLIFPGSR